jgi:hypothetical protein
MLHDFNTTRPPPALSTSFAFDIEAGGWTINWKKSFPKMSPPRNRVNADRITVN